MEFFDVVDDKRKYLGYKKERGCKLNENEYNVGVEIWMFCNNKLLLTQRSLKKSHPGEWEVPGGCSQEGETSEDTLIREVYEEIGIKLNKHNYEFLNTQRYKKQFVDIYKGNLSIDVSNIKIQGDEVSAFKLVTKVEFIEMVNNNLIVKSVFNRYEVIKDMLKKEW